MAGAGVRMMACVRPGLPVAGGGLASVCTQHCMPQPAAQGQPLSWPAGACEAMSEAATAHRLDAKGLAAAIDSGNSKACNATT